VVFAAGPAGIQESRDHGETWNEPASGSPDTAVLAIDPSNHSAMYAGGTSGVRKSIDGGRTWENTALVDAIADLVIDPNDPRRILAGYRDVQRSVDAGSSWAAVLTPEDRYVSYYYPEPPVVNAIAFAPSDARTVYAGGSDDATGILYRSADGGESWSQPAATLVAGVQELAVDSCDPRIVHATTPAAVFRTLDGGESWEPSRISWNADFPYGQVHAIAQDPRHPSSLFAATSQGVFWTVDRGATWNRFEPALTDYVQSLAVDPTGRFLYAGTAHGVFRLKRSFEPCQDGPDRLCLSGRKFQIGVAARDPRTGALFSGRAIHEGDQFGYFSFPEVTGDPVFPEVFVKMVDARGAPPPYGGYAWVFHSSLTDLDYTLTVLENETGRVRTYRAADSASLTCGSADTSAFVRSCGNEESSVPTPATSLGDAAGSGTELSLLNGRFRATLRARDPRTDRIADGVALARADGFGYFSLPGFTADPSLPEVFVKMVDGRAEPGGSFWVFHTGLTDLDYTLTVTDTVTGAVRTYPGGATDGTRLCGFADTAAFRDTGPRGD
jgi:photosystem II stability/assembly factor-like uncharacterized protein